jgi:hypothetical protein
MILKHSLRFVLFACGAVLVFASPVVAEDNSARAGVIDIGTRLELFVDKYLIDELQGAEITLNMLQKAPASPQPPLAPNGKMAQSCKQ